MLDCSWILLDLNLLLNVVKNKNVENWTSSRLQAVIKNEGGHTKYWVSFTDQLVFGNDSSEFWLRVW